MREILFRGKLRGGRWAEGNLEVKKDFVCIITPDDTPLGCYGQVDPDTVGQYTGLTDKNGKKIFEGDIVRVECRGIVKTTNGCVYFKDGVYMISQISSALSLFAYRPYCEVIGNIHDNPELVGGTKKDA